MSWYHWVTGRSTEALTFAQRARSSADRLEDVPLRVAADFYHGTAYLAMTDYRRAASAFGSAAKALEGELIRQRFGLAGFPAAMSRCFLPWALAEIGQFDEGIAHGQEGIRIAEAVEHPYSLIMVYRGLGHLYCVNGDFADAVRLLNAASRSVRSATFPSCSRSPRGPWGTPTRDRGGSPRVSRCCTKP